MAAYYNEIDPAAVHVLRALIAEGVIAPGIVDTRSIKEVTANDLKGFTQCHFFAGGGLWSVAARLAGWPDTRPIWTASCPCQPFSVAGKGAGVDDERHLWPDVDRLVGEARARGFGPPVLVGEQVAGKAGYHWFHGVRADLARQGYRARVVDIPACAVDAPHIRNRQYWCALGDGLCARLEGHARHGDTGRGSFAPRSASSPDGGDMGDGSGDGRDEGFLAASIARYGDQPAAAHGRNGSFWADAEWIICHDGKARRTKPGLRLLVDGIPRRVDLWRIAGNAIVPEAAAQVIGALIDVLPEWRAVA